MNRGGMVVSPQPEATEAGVDILRAGGNAIDAAIGAALVQTVVDPMMCGIGGFGSLGIFMPDRFHGYYDFHAPAPLAARPNMWESLLEGEARDGFGFTLKGRVNDIGYQSICLPAALMAFYESHADHGRLPWSEILLPAIESAERGWKVRPHVARFWNDEGEMGRAPNFERIQLTEDGRKLFCRPNGAPKKIGDLVVNRDYGATLREIAKGGADVFYKGDIAERIHADMKANGGLLSREDLNTYRPKRRDPIWGSYRGHRVATNHPPGGGIMLLEMLNALEHFDLVSIGHNTADYLRMVSEVMKRATADKDRWIGDPDFFDVPVERLISRDYGQSIADDVRNGRRGSVERVGLESKDTTHISVVDREGNCATMTHSLGMPSGVMTPGLGFMYNGCMGVFDPRPGRAGSIAPGKARFSSACPTIVFKDRDPYLVIGAPGGTQIAMGVLQAIVNVIDFGMSMQQAVSAPRFSSTSNAIDVSNRIPQSVARALEGQNYQVIRSPFSNFVAYVHGIRIEDGRLDGGADPGMDGMALPT